MGNKLQKVKLKGNESFIVREGWLRKGIRCLKEDPNLFSNPYAIQKLGVGSKMVKSIKYWLLATTLVEEKIQQGKHNFVPTSTLGEVIDKYDPYFEDIFTLYILHFHLVANKTMAIVWNLFYNNFEVQSFTREEMFNSIKNELDKTIEKEVLYSDSLLKDDCSSLLRMYAPVEAIVDPEDVANSPFATLGLVKRNETNKSYYAKCTPRFEMVDCLLILYIMLENSKDKKSVSIYDLQHSPNNVGKVLNLPRPVISEYLDQLRLRNYITINRTAGLDMVYFADGLTPPKALLDYYSQEGQNEIE